MVKVTALEDLNVATFQLNNALRITKLTDCEQQAADAGTQHAGFDRPLLAEQQHRKEREHYLHLRI